MERIIILDCGSQVTQLIGRRLRELNVFCEIHPFDKMPALDGDVRGVILSGSPCSVREESICLLSGDHWRHKLSILISEKEKGGHEHDRSNPGRHDWMPV